MSLLKSHQLERMKYTYAVARACIAHDSRNLRHRLDPNNALDSKIRLVGEFAREVVSTELVRWRECVLHEILSPIVEDIVLSPAVTPISEELYGGN